MYTCHIEIQVILEEVVNLKSVRTQTLNTSPRVLMDVDFTDVTPGGEY